MKITKLTFNGKSTHAVISPDGRQVVYVIDDGGRRSLWLRQVATGTDVQLTQPEETPTLNPIKSYPLTGLAITN